MNKILPLFEEAFVLDYFRQEVLPLYPDFQDIARVEIKPYKKMVWETTYHVVIGYRVYFLAKDGQEQKIPLVCVAHSDEPRENAFLALQYLWAKNFSSGQIDLPRPLFFSHQFNGTFYRALSGENLLYYIKRRNFAAMAKIVIESAELFARLHALPPEEQANFNPVNSRIRTVLPGADMVIASMSERYGDKYTEEVKQAYKILIAQEETFLARGETPCLIHGDAHPENIIKTGEDRIGLIDFTDFCLGDFARDLGTFLQQLEYKITNKVGDEAKAQEMKALFLDNYLKFSGKTLTPDLQERIGLYYNWTALRTAVFWFLKFEHSERRGAELLAQIKNNLAM